MAQQLDVSNISEYLQSHGLLAPVASAAVRQIAGGVSNVTFYVSRPGGENFVVKQARRKLQVADVWLCSEERIWREVDVLRACTELLAAADVNSPLRPVVPNLLFEDRNNYVYAMSAAPREHTVWKSDLLNGRPDPNVAASCGVLLGRIHAGSWHNASLARTFEDRTFFYDLRVDPFYCRVAEVHSDIGPSIDALVDSVWAERHCLVHGDFSPKNLLVFNPRLMLIDFEVGHFGDPAFDLGFFLSHVMLKAFYQANCERQYFQLTDVFLHHYFGQLQAVASQAELNGLPRRMILNFAGCMLARLDGKSKIDYLTDEHCRRAVRDLCRGLLVDPLDSWAEVLEIAAIQVALRRDHC